MISREPAGRSFPAKWYLIATIQPDGSYSFKAELFDDALVMVPSIRDLG